ncbi:response regulator [Bartonella sp. DGB1]|uniref:response regulator n=1 Tax=Bartonella sp. DGB1 TaxID=3239807 RepID=UPI003524F1B7
MTLSRRISPYLPYLRRFARAVTGSQTSGDAYIAFMLEALIMDLSVFPETSSDKIGLYRLFNHLYQQTSIKVPSPTVEYAWEQQASANLACLTPQARQAFLLISVEDFTTEEAAEILNVSKEEFQNLLMEATAEISAQVSTRILIIEDEPLIAMDIEQLVETLGHRVVGIARTHTEALKLYKETNPGMILADIQLADDSSGIDAVNDILKETSVPVIFITAFPERLLTGQKPEPTFLVTKPFKPDMVKALISQALFFKENAKVNI